MRTPILVICVLVSLATAACRKKGCTDSDADNYDPSAKKDDGSCYFTGPTWYTDVQIGSSTWHQLSDTIYEDVTLTVGENWLLSGGVFIASGVVFTIEPGTTIYAADDATTPFLSVLQGAAIDACGTAAAPIVFTSMKTTPQPGDWAGIILNGLAVINTGLTAEGDGGTGIYGGSNDADFSGSLCYVRVEYAGATLGSTPSNAFSFNGCGDATELNHLQAYRCAGDGVKFRGGQVNLKYALSSGCAGNSFVWTDGWRGNAQFWVCEQSGDAGDFGILGMNQLGNEMASPVSDPIISNVTLIGMDDGDGNNIGIRFSGGTQGDIYNTVLTGFPKRGVQTDGDSTISKMTQSLLTLSYSITDNVYPFKFIASSGNDTVTVLMMNDATFENQIASDGSLVGFLDGFVGTETGSAFDPFVIGGWFTSAPYVGAVDPLADWTLGWTKDL